MPLCSGSRRLVLPRWSKIYFVLWWLVSSVVWVNLFLALILEVSETPAWAVHGAFPPADWAGAGRLARNMDGSVWAGPGGPGRLLARPDVSPVGVRCQAPGWGWGGSEGGLGRWLLQDLVALLALDPGIWGGHWRGGGGAVFLRGPHSLASLHPSCIPELPSQVGPPQSPAVPPQGPGPHL